MIEQCALGCKPSCKCKPLIFYIISSYGQWIDIMGHKSHCGFSSLRFSAYNYVCYDPHLCDWLIGCFTSFNFVWTDILVGVCMFY